MSREETMRQGGDTAVHVLYDILTAPLTRMQHTTPGERVFGILSGLWAFITADAFTLAILLLVASGTADTIYGRAIHKQLDTYDQTKAEIGLLSKIMGVVMTMLIRGFEGWWSRIVVDGPFDGWHTSGYLSMAVAVTLFVHDLKSIQDKRVRFGQPPLPVLTQVLAILDGLAHILGAGPPDNRGSLKRRSSDTVGVDQPQRREDDRPTEGE